MLSVDTCARNRIARGRLFLLTCNLPIHKLSIRVKLAYDSLHVSHIYAAFSVEAYRVRPSQPFHFHDLRFGSPCSYCLLLATGT
jgi:hypothetical protein